MMKFFNSDPLLIFQNKYGPFHDPTSTIDKFSLTIPFEKLDIVSFDNWSNPAEAEFDINDIGFWEDVAEVRLPHNFILHWDHDSYKVEWSKNSVNRLRKTPAGM